MIRLRTCKLIPALLDKVTFYRYFEKVAGGIISHLSFYKKGLSLKGIVPICNIEWSWRLQQGGPS